MGRVIGIIPGKSGAGATVLTAILGSALAGAGKKVCLVDMDIGGLSLHTLMGLENRLIYDLCDVAKGHAQVKSALIKDKHQESLCLLVAARRHESGRALTAEKLDLILQLVAEEFDFILLDCPAGFDDPFQLTRAVAEHAILVCTPAVQSVRTAARVRERWEEAGRRSGALLVVNCVEPDLLLPDLQLQPDECAQKLGCELLGAVSADVSLRKAVYARGLTDPGLDSLATREIREIAQKMTRSGVPDPALVGLGAGRAEPTEREVAATSEGTDAALQAVVRSVEEELQRLLTRLDDVTNRVKAAMAALHQG